MKRATLIMMVAFALGGCTSDRDVAQCELEAIRLYPGIYLEGWSEFDTAASQYVVKCMRAKGHEFSRSSTPLSCSPYSFHSATQSACYKSTDWLSGLLERKKAE